MVPLRNILILKDGPLTLSKILEKLSKLEQDQPYDFSIMCLTTYLHVENFINKNKEVKFEIILLDNFAEDVTKEVKKMLK